MATILNLIEKPQFVAAERHELAPALIELSQATQTAYDAAIDNECWDIATELRVLGGQVATLIAKSLRGSLESVS